MAVRSIGPNAIEFTEDGDLLLEEIKINSFAAFTGDDSGSVKAVSKILNIHPNGVIEYDPSEEAVLWTSGAMNANDIRESAVDIDRAYGIRADLPSGGRLVVYTE